MEIINYIIGLFLTFSGLYIIFSNKYTVLISLFNLFILICFLLFLYYSKVSNVLIFPLSLLWIALTKDYFLILVLSLSLLFDVLKIEKRKKEYQEVIKNSKIDKDLLRALYL